MYISLSPLFTGGSTDADIATGSSSDDEAPTVDSKYNAHYVSTIMHLILAVTTSNSISVHSLIINIPQFKWFTNYRACQLDRELPCKPCAAVLCM